MQPELEESMMLLWLKKKNNCQITQLNWRATKSNTELTEDSYIKKIISTTKMYLSNKNINLNMSPQLGFLQKSNIDVLGLEISSGIVNNIYGVYIFNEKTEENNAVQLASIFENLVNAAILIYGNFKINKAEIIFIAPKVHLGLNEQLTSLMNNLNELFKSLDLQYTFLMYTNEVYKNNVLDTVLTNHIASHNLKGLHQDVRTQDHFAMNSDKTTVKIGALVRNEFGKLVDKGLISKEMLKHLTDSKYSKETFLINYPMLKKINNEQPVQKQRTINGYYRYLSQSYRINGQKYLLCNDWYEKNRSKFLLWLEKFDKL